MPVSVSIHLSGPSFADRLRRRTTSALRWARSKVLGAPLPSYERSRRELGGMPWRKLDNTEGWFLVSAHGLSATEVDDWGDAPGRESSVELSVEAAPDLRTPLLSRRGLALAGAAGLFAVSVVLLVTRGPAGAVAPPALVVPTPAAPPSVEAPVRPESPAPAPAAFAKAGRERHAKRKPAHARSQRM